METDAVSRLWLRGALVWLVGAMAFGTYLGLTEQFGFSSSHAHAGLLGGVWGALFAFGYSRSAPGRPVALAAVQWALFNLSAAFHTFSLWMVMHGHGIFGMFLGINSLLLIAITLWIAANIWRRLV